MNEQEDLVTLKMERQNSTQDTLNQPFVSRTYEENAYARLQWQSWWREQTLRRLAELFDAPFGSNEVRECNKLLDEISQNHTKGLITDEQFDKQTNYTLSQRMFFSYQIREFRANREKMHKVLPAVLHGLSEWARGNVLYEHEDEDVYRCISIQDWISILYHKEGVSLYELNRFETSCFIDWVRQTKALGRLAKWDRYKQEKLVKELRDLELPRLVSKRNKGLKWPLKDDQVKMHNTIAENPKRTFYKRVNQQDFTEVLENDLVKREISYQQKPIRIQKPIVTMHPFVDQEHKDTLVVGDYKRVSTVQALKHKWFSTYQLNGIVAEAWELGGDAFTGMDPDFAPNCSKFWFRFIQKNHPKYRQDIQQQMLQKLQNALKSDPELSHF